MKTDKLSFTLLLLILCSCQLSIENEGTSKESLSPTVRHTIETVLRAPSIDTISPLKGGLSASTLYKFSTNHHDYVLRLITHRSLEDRTREIKAQEIAAQIGYGPKTYYASIADGIIIMDFLKNDSIQKGRQQPNSFYNSLGKLVKAIHTSPSFAKGTPIFEQINQKFSEINWDKVTLLSQRSLKSMIEDIVHAAQRYPSKAPTHRDLNPNNILIHNSKVFVIDFENAAQDDPYFDLGTIGNFFLFNDSHTALFLTSYFGRSPHAKEKAKFYLMKQLSLIFYGLELLAHVPEKDLEMPLTIIPLADVFTKIDRKEILLEESKGKAALALSLLQEALHNGQSATFKAALKAL